jgi:hypothetical protein
MSSSTISADLCVFTTGADDLLIESGKRVGIEVHNYPCAPFPGYVTGKLKRGVEFLKTRNEKYAMWVDGRDSLILKPASYIQRFCPLLPSVMVASEHNCWPDQIAARYYSDWFRNTRTYLNAGGFLGYRNCLIRAMMEVISCAEDGDEDDQRAWTTAFLRGTPTTIGIDQSRRVFCSEGDGDTQSADPCVRHWNGRVPGRQEFWEALNK